MGTVRCWGRQAPRSWTCLAQQAQGGHWRGRRRQVRKGNRKKKSNSGHGQSAGLENIVNGSAGRAGSTKKRKVVMEKPYVMSALFPADR